LIVDDLERLIAELSCQRLVVDYCRWLDAGDADRFAMIFVDDAVWDMVGYFRLETRDAIVARMIKPRAGTSRHLVANVAVDLLSADEASGSASFVNYRDEAVEPAGHPLPAGEPRYVGRYLDRFVRTEDGWRIARRRVELDFASRLP
jgi:hypothetical protein